MNAMNMLSLQLIKSESGGNTYIFRYFQISEAPKSPNTAYKMGKWEKLSHHLCRSF